MKFRYLVMGILAMAALLSCEEEVPQVQVLNLEKETITMASTEAWATCKVVSNQAWTAKADVEWIHLDPSSGTGAEDPVRVMITADDNPVKKERIALITVESGEMKRELKITQIANQNGIESDPEPEPEPNPDPEPEPEPEPEIGGTEENPYRIQSSEDLKQMGVRAVQGVTTYFVLENDIDMSSVSDWTPVNGGAINFDGRGNTIVNLTSSAENSSLFGVFTGVCKNLTIENAVIGTTKIAGGFAGTVIDATFENCHAVNLTIDSEVDYSGGIAGTAQGTCTFSRCSVSGKVTGKQMVGGILGNNEGTLTISDCFTTCEVYGTGQITGGILGRAFYSYGADGKANTGDEVRGSAVVERCYSTGAVTASRAAAGIVSVGHTSDLTVTGCIAWNTSIKATDAGSGHYYSGAVRAGCAATAIVTASDCYRKADLTISAYEANVVADSENQSAASGAISDAYHGKAAATDATVSGIASTLGWSSEIWDLTGDMPVLK